MAATPGRAKVAAIDFGTGFCSLAYTMKEDDVIGNILLSPDHERVPTAVLLKKNEADGTLKVSKFGILAQREILKIKSEDMSKYLYFECFKMDLLQESVSPDYTDNVSK